MKIVAEAHNLVAETIAATIVEADMAEEAAEAEAEGAVTKEEESRNGDLSVCSFVTSRVI